jgi:hypothetical protein
VNPEPFTFAELALMAEGRQREEWSRWSEWFAMFANANRDSKQRPTPYLPREFNPFAEREAAKKFGKTESVKKIAELFGARKG